MVSLVCARTLLIDDVSWCLTPTLVIMLNYVVFSKFYVSTRPCQGRVCVRAFVFSTKFYCCFK